MRTHKQYLQRLLAQAGLYQRVKGSSLYDAYWRVADRRILAERSRELQFYRSVLTGMRKGDLILDIGANHGTKTDIFLRLGARVIAVEPDELNQRVLRQRFLKYRLLPKPVVIIGKAVSDANTIETMWIATPGSAKNTLSRKWVETLKEDGRRFGQTLDFSGQQKVETITLDQLIAAYGAPYFVKIDIEGFELHALRGMHVRVPYLSFEVNLPEFAPEGLECVEMLRRVAVDGTFNYAADCRQGLALKQWIDAEEFSHVLKTCDENSIEIFWRTGSESVRGR